MPLSKPLTATSLGKKAVMAVSGLVLFGFVLVHMAGNLKMYLGQATFDHYAAGLRELGAPVFPYGSLLWVARLVLLAAVVAHMLAAWQTTRQSHAARQQKYAKHVYQASDYAARTMRWGGVILAFFIAYHLLHLTLGVVHPSFQHPEVLPDGTHVYHAYHNVVTGFQNPLVVFLYVAANLALGFHLFHGVWSFLQSLGLNHPRYNSWRRTAAALFALLVTAGNVSFPIAVLTGIVALPG